MEKNSLVQLQRELCDRDTYEMRSVQLKMKKRKTNKKPSVSVESVYQTRAVLQARGPRLLNPPLA